MIVEVIGRLVVVDFCLVDFVVGGVGVLLVLFVDWVMFVEDGKKCVLFNVGGLVNIIFLFSLDVGGLDVGGVVVFDIGFGNCLFDEFVG